jgi:hypothetical protein
LYRLSLLLFLLTRRASPSQQKTVCLMVSSNLPSEYELLLYQSKTQRRKQLHGFQFHQGFDCKDKRFDLLMQDHYLFGNSPLKKIIHLIQGSVLYDFQKIILESGIPSPASCILECSEIAEGFDVGKKQTLVEESW